jgi:NAD(P)-dependent dehydrogenase (short-subunit alcohol dehydrogenase family)
MLLENNNAVIYGAGGAIGGAVARAFAREGATVFLAGRTQATLDPVATEISDAGGTARTAVVDALDEQAVEDHIGSVADAGGRVDVLFNAIGMHDIQGTPLLDMSVDDVVGPTGVALRTQFLTARAVARRMVGQRAGVILTVTAGPARQATPLIGGFGVSCEAIEGLWRTWAAELGQHGIRVVCLRSAGSPDTPAIQGVAELHAAAAGVTSEQFVTDLGRGTLLGRLPLVAEVANAAALLASDHASALTGTYINVTCGSPVD